MTTTLVMVRVVMPTVMVPTMPSRRVQVRTASLGIHRHPGQPYRQQDHRDHAQRGQAQMNGHQFGRGVPFFKQPTSQCRKLNK